MGRRARRRRRADLCRLPHRRHYQCRPPSAGQCLRHHDAPRARRPERAVHPRRHVACPPAERLRLRARDEPDVRLSGGDGAALSPTHRAVIVDEILDGLALDWALSGPNRRARVAARDPRRGPDARRDLPRSGISHDRSLAERMGRSRASASARDSRSTDVRPSGVRASAFVARIPTSPSKARTTTSRMEPASSSASTETSAGFSTST